jgi:hypothetical protein
LYGVYDTGRAIVYLYPPGPGAGRWADATLTPTDLSQLKGYINALIPGTAQLSNKTTDGMSAWVSDSSDTVATAWYDGKPHTVTGTPNLAAFTGRRLVEQSRYDALAQIGNLLQSRGASAPDYTPTGVALYTQRESNPIASVPWPALPLDTFGEPRATENARCGVVTGDDMSAVTAALAGGAKDWSSGGSVYLVQAQPLLPGQSTCQDAFP